jgi:hypothetical protein
MENKGQYALILFDVRSKNISGETYVSTKLEELKNGEILKVNLLQN